VIVKKILLDKTDLFFFTICIIQQYRLISDCVMLSYLQAAANMKANLIFRVILDLIEVLFTPQHVAFLKSITNLSQFCLSFLLIQINK